MPEVIINGPAGRIEGRYHHESSAGAPIAIILHPHPQFGGTMNNQIVYSMYYTFVKRRYSVLRFNFRGVGRSQGIFDQGPGELSDAATALDWLQLANPDAKSCWIAGVSFVGWIAMQLLMRRPEIDGFIAVAPPGQSLRFQLPGALPVVRPHDQRRPRPRRPVSAVKTLVDKLKTQRGIVVTHEIVPGANHFFEDKVEDLTQSVERYLDKRALAQPKPGRKEKTPPPPPVELELEEELGEEE